MNYQLEQTGEQVQEILNQAPTTEQNLQNEITRSTGKDEELEAAIGNEKDRAEGVEAELQTSIGNEKTRAEGVEAELQTAIANEKSRAEGVEGGLRTDVDGIEAKIPAGASEQNKLATESFVNSSVATNTADFKGTFPSLEALQTEVHDANANDYAFVISTDTAGNTVYNRYKYVTGTGWVFEYALNNSSFTAAQWAAIQSGITALLVAKLTGLPTVAELTQQLNTIIASVSDEQTRAEGAEAVLRQSIADNATAIANEKTRAQNAEGTLSTNIVNEENRAKAAEVVLQQNIDAEAILRDNADDALQAQIDDTDAKIPEQASASNQLADKSFVNSSIATNTADFKGTYNSLQELQQVSANNNDYGFVVSVDSYGNTVYNRYKYVDGTGWVFEYALNNSSFTSAQWAAIQSGITAALVAKLNGLPDITALNAMFAAITNLIPSAATSENKLVDYAQMVAALATKQNTLIFDNVPTEGSNNPVKSGGVFSALATLTLAIAGIESSKQDKLTFDAYPTAGSDNPVKSKGIYEKLAEKQATLVPGTNLDTTPTANSNNPVTSGGVKAALDLKANQSALDLKANQSALAEEVSRAQGAESELSSRISTNATDIANLQQLYNNLQQSKPVPVTSLPSSGQQQGVIYRLAGTTSYSDYMWNGSSWVLMATYNNAIDPRPKKASQNLVTSGGVFDNMGALDVSELNATENPHTLAQYADLSSALAAIPTDYQKGGMSIKFVQSSDNKYAQYRLMSNTFNTIPANWAAYTENRLVEDDNYIYVITDSDSKLLFAIKTNGSIVFGEGVPQQTVDYINGLDIQKYGTYIDDANFLQVLVDAEKHVLLGIKKDGTLVCNNIESPIITSILQIIEGAGMTHTLNVQNSDKIAIIGDSYTESGYSVKGKSYIQKLSLFSDFIFSNYGASGETYVGRMYDIRRKSSDYGTIPLDEQGIKYVMLCCYTNDIKYMSDNDYISCVEEVVEFVRGIGMTPIICTEYHTGNGAVRKTSVRSALAKLAENSNVPFYDIASINDLILTNKYAPFWGGSHPGTRTNAIEADNYEKYLSSLERPMKSLKLFRARNNSYSSLDEYMFHSVENRAELFKEISVGARDLTDPDNVDDCNEKDSVIINSEYQAIAKNQPVLFGNVSLISAVLSVEKKDLTSLILNITHDSASLRVLVKNTLAEPYPIPTLYSAFYVDYSEAPSVDSTYRCEEDEQVYTVKSVITDSEGQKSLLCLPFVANPSANSGTLTKVSGTGDASITYTHRERGMDIGSIISDTIGHWEEVIAGEDGKYNLISKPNCVDVDRVDILLLSDSSFNMTDVLLEYTGTEKDTHKKEDFVFKSNYYNTNTELLPSSTFGEIGVLDDRWNVTPTNTYEGLHGTNVFPVGCSSKVNVDSVNKLSCSVVANKTGDAVLEVWCRYFPEVFTDGSDGQITENSYDYSNIIVSINGVEMKERVNTHWKIVQFPVHIISGSHTIEFSSDKGIEISYVSLKF